MRAPVVVVEEPFNKPGRSAADARIVAELIRMSQAGEHHVRPHPTTPEGPK